MLLIYYWNVWKKIGRIIKMGETMTYYFYFTKEELSKLTPAKAFWLSREMRHFRFFRKHVYHNYNVRGDEQAEKVASILSKYGIDYEVEVF